MRTHVLVSCAAASLAMLGCNPAPDQKAKSSAQPPAPAMMAQTDAGKSGSAAAKQQVAKKCKKDDCEIKVNVANCVVAVVEDPVGVTRGIPDVPITWTLQQNDFEFVAKGIVFKGNPASFTPGSPSSNGKSFTVIDKNNESVDTPYKYSVAVKRKNGADCPIHDPTIINGY